MQVSEARVASLVAGNNLRASRERLGLTMRDVESASMRLAARHGNDEFVINPSRLSDIETKGLVPSVYRLYTLAIVYRCDLREIDRKSTRLNSSHTVISYAVFCLKK